MAGVPAVNVPKWMVVFFDGRHSACGNLIWPLMNDCNRTATVAFHDTCHALLCRRGDCHGKACRNLQDERPHGFSRRFREMCEWTCIPAHREEHKRVPFPQLLRDGPGRMAWIPYKRMTSHWKRRSSFALGFSWWAQSLARPGPGGSRRQEQRDRSSIGHPEEPPKRGSQLPGVSQSAE
jgi:hypothetical protein